MPQYMLTKTEISPSEVEDLREKQNKQEIIIFKL